MGGAMSAPKVARSQQTAASSTIQLSPHRPARVAQFGGAGESALQPGFGQRVRSGRNGSGINADEEEARELADRGEFPLPKAAVPSWDFSKISILPPGQQPSSALPRLQPKLAIGSANDPLEREADRVADQVMRMPDPALSIAAAPAQLSRKCAACEEEDKKKLQMKPARPPETAGREAPPIVHEVLRSPGEPLDAATRAFFEPRLGYDFSGVRVHADEPASTSAKRVNARAYAVGSNIVFGPGEWSPSTDSGKRLLAHELAHVSSKQEGTATSARLTSAFIVGRVLSRSPSPRKRQRTRRPRKKKRK
jgi:hypothetical protein